MQLVDPIAKRVKEHINGILLLDKPKGISSNKALQEAKYLFKAKKAGHAGNLDPLASGVLPICFGEATKFAGFLLEADKTYLVTAKLGERTDTADAEGQIIAKKPVPELTFAKVQQLLWHFCGEIEQIPPMYSALKHNGQPLYKLARQGIEIERKVRKVTIHKIELLAQENEHITFSVHCSKGTYVRTIVDDLGELFQCGAHVTELRRLSAGNYPIENTITLPALAAMFASGNVLAAKQLLLPVDSAIIAWPEVMVPDAAIAYLMKGQKITVAAAPSYGLVRLKAASDGRFLGIGEAVGQGGIAPKRLINTA